MYNFHLVEPHLHLALDAVVGSVDELIACGKGVLIDILHLQAALFEEPVLEACNGFVLVVAKVCVEVEEVVRADKLQLWCPQRNSSRQVCAPAVCIAVPAVQVFAVNLEGSGLVVGTYRGTVALVVLPILDAGVIYRTELPLVWVDFCY